MFTKTDNRPTSKLKLFIAAALIFNFFSSYSQSNKINISPLTLDIEGGVNVPIGDFKDYATKGYQIGLMLNKEVYKNLGFGVSANYNRFGIKDDFESTDNSWTNISFGIGPQYTLPINMLFIQLYGHIGMSLIKTPGMTKNADNTPDNFEKYDEGFFNTFKIASENPTGFHTDVGIKIGAQLSSKIRLFVGSNYNTSLSSPVKYSSRDISKAFQPSADVEMDVIRSTPFEEKSLVLSSFNVNAGISINLGKTSAAKPAQDYNSSRSNRPTPMSEIVDKKENDSVPKPLYAQDYNSSRSNKPTPIRDIITGNDTVPKPAQDYNSSRSNRPTPMSEIANKNDNDTVPRPLYAQDYNSSRSNRPTPLRDLATGNDTVPKPAQDYNSSRSNKPRPMSEIVDKNDNDTLPRPLHAQDYNSSRSNRPTPMSEIADKNENDSVQGPLYAQDYNSSRSNKPSPIAWSDSVIGNDTVPKPAQDYNSSRSNRPTPIRVIDEIDDITDEENRVVVIGKLSTITLKSRSFELIDKNKRKITGQIQSQITDKEIKQLKRQFENKKVMVYVDIKRVQLDSGKEAVSYKLLKIQKQNKKNKFIF